ncbi:MAG: hypothetical protein NUV75_11410 [Gallionella sp.]|nr:hypothetical protein [Gallionella sp.]
MDLPDKRSTDTPLLDPARILAIIYTAGYFYIVYLMMTRVLPDGNEGALNQLIGALTIIQTSIVQYYFGGSKSAEKAQMQIASSKEKSDVVMAEIAKAAPMPAVIPAPVDPAAAPPKEP